MFVARAAVVFVVGALGWRGCRAAALPQELPQDK